MVQAMIRISEKTNHILNIIKARYKLKNKSKAIDYITIKYAEEFLEPELRPEFIKRIKEIAKEKSVLVKDFKKRYGLE